MQFEFTTGPHPSQAQDPVTRQPMVDKHGDPVPMYPDVKSLLYKDRLIGFIYPKTGLRFVIPCAMLGDVLADAARQYAKNYTTSDVAVDLDTRALTESEDDDNEDDD